MTKEDFIVQTETRLISGVKEYINVKIDDDIFFTLPSEIEERYGNGVATDQEARIKQNGRGPFEIEEIRRYDGLVVKLVFTNKDRKKVEFPRLFLSDH